MSKSAIIMLPHADFPTLTLQELQTDLSKRLRESKGTVVAYSSETVQALISKIEQQHYKALDVLARLDALTEPSCIDVTSTSSGRRHFASLLVQARDTLAHSIDPSLPRREDY